jgi:hypothetical protein
MQYFVSKGTGGDGTHSSFAEQPAADCQSGEQATACIPHVTVGTEVDAFGLQLAPLPADPDTVTSAPVPHMLIADCTDVQPAPDASVRPPPVNPHEVVHPPVPN